MNEKKYLNILTKEGEEILIINPTNVIINKTEDIIIVNGEKYWFNVISWQGRIGEQNKKKDFFDYLSKK